MTSCHCQSSTASLDAPIILVGNPNVGKSVLFGLLTGRYVTVSNYPGTTVEITQGSLPDGTPVIDTPGTNTLSSNSDDERVTAEVLLNQRNNVRAVVQVADAKNLRRALLLTLQLADLNVPLVLNLNMLDEAEAHGVSIDTAKLSERLGVEVVTTVATRKVGLNQLTEAIQAARSPIIDVAYDPTIEMAVGQVCALLPEELSGQRGVALRLLGGDGQLAEQFGLEDSLTTIQQNIRSNYDRPLKTVITSQQIEMAQRLLDGVVTESYRSKYDIARWLSHWMVHPLIGWPLLGGVLWLVYKLVGEFGAGVLVDFLEGTVFGAWINPLATKIVDTLVPIPFVHDLIVGEYGIVTMALAYGLALVFPIVTTFFLAFSVLEDSGYLPRLAVMLNRAFKLMGLNGKAVLPMVLGLGCDTMATMSTRILETRKERILVTLLLVLGVPCSAQLGVILGMLGTVGAVGAFIWGGVVIATMFAVGLLAARLLPGERSDFILELPPLRMPRLENIVVKVLARVEWYLKEVIPLFIVGTLLLFILDKTGVLVIAEKIGEPIVTGWLGLPAAATGAFLIGFLRRDYGAAGLFALMLNGQLNTTQTLISLIVVTLFVPCIANILMIVKEYGLRIAIGVATVVFPLAFIVGGIVNIVLRLLNIVV